MKTWLSRVIFREHEPSVFPSESKTDGEANIASV
jgi:hypothetical protein